MTKFEVGDKVIISVPLTDYEHNGKKGVITKVFNGFEIVDVTLNDGAEDFTLIFNVSNIKKVNEINTPAYQNYFLDQTYLLVEELSEDNPIISFFDLKRIRSTVMMISQDSFLAKLNITNKLLKMLETIYSNSDHSWVISEIRNLYHVLKESLENN